MGPETHTPVSGKVLVVDDEVHGRNILKEAIESMGYEALTCESAFQAMQRLRSDRIDVLLTDLRMPGTDGIKLLEQALELDSSLSVILVTAHGTIETAVEAIKKGAEDYLLKPIEFPALELVLRRVFSKRVLLRENRKLQRENETLRQSLGLRYHLTGAIGKSALAQKLLDGIQKAAGHRKPVLILGEPGVGRDDVARMIHYNSPWASNDLILFDCASVPAELQELHLFGEEEGSSGLGRAGLVEKAHLGTLVILQIERLSEKAQSRLTWVLSEAKTQRVGGKRFYPVNVRLIATSGPMDLERASLNERFRIDIRNYFAETEIQVPPLRERKEDIPVLAAVAAKQMCAALGKEPMRIDPLVFEMLQAADYPGNGRELRSLVESAVMRCTDSVLKPEHFSPAFSREKEI